MFSKVERTELLKTHHESVIKCALRKTLVNEEIIGDIDKLVDVTSKLINKCGLVLDRLILYCFSENIELPNLNDGNLYLQCATIGTGTTKLRKPITPIVEVWEIFKQAGYPLPDRVFGDRNSISYGCITYKTSFINSVWTNFHNRQKLHVKAWCEEYGHPKEQVNSICKWINGYDDDIDEEFFDFVAEQRAILELDVGETVTKDWRKKNVSKILYYYFYIRGDLEEWEGQTFTLAPHPAIRNASTILDTGSLFKIFVRHKWFTDGAKKTGGEKAKAKKEAANLKVKKKGAKEKNEKKPTPLESFCALASDHWKTVFKFPKPPANSIFTGLVSTDGTNISVHFYVPKQGVSQALRNYPSGKQRVIANDPGRSNIFYGVEEKDDESFETYKFTRNEYNHKAGIAKAKKKAEQWNEAIKPILNDLSENSPKTNDSNKWNNYLQIYSEYYEIFWDHFTEKKWSRQRFHLYIMKRKAVDQFFQSLTFKGSSKPKIAYGSAKFGSTGRGEVSVPTTAMYKACSRYYWIELVDEFRTTMCCAKCGDVLHKVATRKDGKLLDVRGLRWCGSTKCRKFLSRDKNAALNILACFVAEDRAEDRPEALKRKKRTPVIKPTKVIPPYPKSNTLEI